MAQKLMRSSLRSRRTTSTMESKAKIFGHAIHPILIVYPLGLLSAAVVFDVIYLVTGNPTWTTVSFWMIAAGIVGGLLAAVFGLIDYLNIPSGTRAARIGVGVTPDANLNAPNSLTHSARDTKRAADGRRAAA